MKVVIVGGGTAGWLTALMARQCLPNDDITLVESEEIGILGAGEGTTPQIIPALQFLGIPISDLIRFTDATIKHSILFSNWNGDGTSYSHGFATQPEFSFVPDPWAPTAFANATTNDSYMYQKHFNDPYEANVISMLLSTMNKSPFIDKPVNLANIADPIEMFDKVCNFAIHFNAVRLADFLKEVAIHRGVTRIEAKVQKINCDSDGSIVSFDIGDNRVVEADFVFDCSGFARLIIGKHFKSEWVSFKDVLPADKALGYFKPQQSNIPAHTVAMAMKNGWSWQIPLQTRWGAGYVYSSAHTDEDEVRKEIIGMEGGEESIQWGKTFTFEAGYFKDVWVKNCAAIGLSAGFFEPLEATSIMQSLKHLENIFSLRLNILEVPKREKERVSKLYADSSEEIAAFLYLHYLTDREDTDFWKQFHRMAPNMPSQVKEIVEISRYRQVVFSDFLKPLSFGIENWTAIIDGIRLITDGQYKEMFANRRIDRTQEYFSLRRNISIQGRKCINHTSFLAMMKA